MTADNSRHRLGLLAVTGLSLFAALFARLWFLQIVEGDTLAVQAEGNATREVVIPAARGRILDRNGLVLVDNRQSIVVGIDAQEFGDLEDDEQASLLDKLSGALSEGKAADEQLTVEDLQRKLNDSRYSQFRPIPVAEDITEEDEIYFAEQADQYPSVVVERTTVRDYPYGSLAAHVIGYVGPLSDTQWEDLKDDNDADKPYIQTDEIGKSGVESSYEEYLRGTPGRQVYEVDRSGRLVREIVDERVEPKTGEDLYLSLDARVQYKSEAALQAQLTTKFQGPSGEEAGGMVVLDQSTGQVRAMASYPTYNPADLVGGISQAQWADLQGQTLDDDGDPVEDEDGKVVQGPSKLLNRAIQGAYPPASTFKLASSYAALKDGLRTPEYTIADPGYERLCDGDGPGCLKKNAGSEPHGSVALAKSLTVSSDVYYYKIGREFWEQREEYGEAALQDAIRDLGYGERSGIDLPAESAGLLPTPESEASLAAALYESDPGFYDNDPDVAADAGRWRTGFSADLAIGQKVNATPLQTANAYATLANGGKLMKPSVMDKITEAGDITKVVVQHEPEVIREIDWGDAYDDYMDGFRGVVDPTGQNDRGTAVAPFSGFPFGSMPLAGKTGTAQTGEDELGYEKPDNSVFVGFSIGGETNWTASAMLEFSGAGGEAAAPAVRMVLEPIADGTIYQFTVPKGGEIDAEQAANDASGIATSASD